MENLESAVSRIAQDNLGRKTWDVPLDYFSWGRDDRHRIGNTELPDNNPPEPILKAVRRKMGSMIKRIFTNPKKSLLSQFRKQYASFDSSYRLMSDPYSRNLFSELIFMRLVSEKGMRLSSFTQEFVDSYEAASKQILDVDDIRPLYTVALRKISLDAPPVSFYTDPETLNLHLTGKLYRYGCGETVVEVEDGDIVLDAGVGWGDTAVYLAACAGQESGGHVYAFDMLQEGMDALSMQRELNPQISNITPVLRALADRDGDPVNITAPSPAARVVDEKTEKTAEAITIDTFANENALKSVDFIKMDIEGSEIPALTGATRTIQRFKPKLAISAYHKWQDLSLIPQLIHGIRDDYGYYLDCNTGFGGAAILYCR